MGIVRIAIVGASVRAAAHSALRDGFEPVAADLFRDRDLGDRCSATAIDNYPVDFHPWLQSVEVDAWIYTGALENHPDLVDRMAAIVPLLGNQGARVQLVRSPDALACRLNDHGLLFPETRSTAEDLPCNGSWLRKSYRASSGHGVWSHDPRTASDPSGALQDNNKPVCPPLFFQRRLEGDSVSAVFVAAGGQARLLGVTRQLVGVAWTGAQPFQYAGSLGPLRIDERVHQTIENIGAVLASEFKLRGLFGVDLIINHAGVWVLEVNPRYTSSVEIVERMTGCKMLQSHAIACSTGVLPEVVTPCEVQQVGKAILFARRSVKVSEEFSAWACHQNDDAPWPELADIPPPETQISAGQPVLTVFATGRDAQDLESQLQKRLSGVQGKLYR
ncbi:MAG: ATP-grasp domain-containing protein [Pirellulales bacterium]|nr:ATP-grasp domain-containing protein [Pirellulales bacterium]